MPTIISSEGYADTRQTFDGAGGGLSPKKIILILLALIIVIALILFFVFRSLVGNEQVVIDDEPEQEQVVVRPNIGLPLITDPEYDNITDITTSVDLMIDSIAFSDFYEKIDIDVRAQRQQYSLPINTKIEVINYHDTARKLNLDPVIDEINENGFAVISNPWQAETADFYSIYSKLREEQLPLYISSDFLLYYHQNIMKKAFKDIEENIFFDNLWDISKVLYERAKTRYEVRLATVGSVNDPMLEAARLETVYFAVSLELLKPMIEQIAPTGVQVNHDRFSVSEANRFNYILPPNLRTDVEAEVKLIREARQAVKSPVMLYVRDYASFAVPNEYKRHAKLNNFYLAAKWLNSPFPLYYQEDNCPNCLLDREDWRINFIASLLITQDFDSLPEIKNRWARIYKIISFFKGLRDDLDYTNYRDSLIAVFGEDYDVEEMISGTNAEIDENLNKISTEIAKYQFSEIQGGPSENDMENKVKIGLKVLADSYSPDNYLLNRLVNPVVGEYLAGSAFDVSNISGCRQSTGLRRCSGISLDIINLVYPISNNPYFSENTNYARYETEASRLSKEIATSVEKRISSYWSFLATAYDYLNFDRSKMGSYATTESWEKSLLNSASSAWVNMRLPFEKYNIKQAAGPRGLDDFSRWNNGAYIETNLALLNELISVNKMVVEMLQALRIETEVRQVIEETKLSLSNLERIQEIIIKEISGEALDSSDFEFISDFASQLEIVEPNKNKSVSIRPDNYLRNLNVDINEFKLMVVVNNRNGEKFFSIGPVWNYRESSR